MTKTLLTTEELSKRWNLKTQTLCQWRWNSRGPQYIKVEGRVLYRLRDIEDFEEKKIRCRTAYEVCGES